MVLKNLVKFKKKQYIQLLIKKMSLLKRNQEQENQRADHKVDLVPDTFEGRGVFRERHILSQLQIVDAHQPVIKPVEQQNAGEQERGR